MFAKILITIFDVLILLAIILLSDYYKKIPGLSGDTFVNFVNKYKLHIFIGTIILHIIKIIIFHATF